MASDGPNGEASMPFKLPPMGTPIQGRPITDDLRDMFSPWGEPTGIIVSDQSGIIVTFHGDFQIKFVPASVQYG